MPPATTMTSTLGECRRHANVVALPGWGNSVYPWFAAKAGNRVTYTGIRGACQRIAARYDAMGYISWTCGTNLYRSGSRYMNCLCVRMARASSHMTDLPSTPSDPAIDDLRPLVWIAVVPFGFAVVAAGFVLRGVRGGLF